MCGIAGIARFDGKIVDQGELDRMTDALAHRGPDGRGTAIQNNVGLGHRRLSVIDLSDAASQPMHSKDGMLTLIFNGEIYNFQEERQILQTKGHVFHSKGDTEVLLALYEEYGEECLEHLRGMFAFAIHDRRKNTLFLARDRVGKKPLVYFLQNGVFAFASELKALQCVTSCPQDTDDEALHHFLTLTYLPAPFTGIRGIERLPAGHSLTLDLKTGTPTLHRYWALRYTPQRTRTIESWTEELLSLLKESVALRMIADVPVGAFLSGGIDSSAVVALMSTMHPEPVKTFSVGSPYPGSELPDADRIAKAFGTEHHPMNITPDLPSLLPKLVRTYEQPFGDPSAIPTYLIAEHTRKHVTVALSGDGGDENFGGYLRYPILAFSEILARLPSPLLGLLQGMMSSWYRLRPSTLTYRGDAFTRSLSSPWPERGSYYMGGFLDSEKADVYSNEVRDRFAHTPPWFAAHTVDARSRADDLIHGAMSMDLETYLPDDLMPKVDLGAMAHGLEVRAPLLDHVLLEHTARIPSELLIQGRKTKVIFKQTMQNLLPKETLQKRKQGFRLPLDRWFRTTMQTYLEERILSAPSNMWRILDRAKIEQFLQRYTRSNIDYSSQCWLLLWLSEWHEQQALAH